MGTSRKDEGRDGLVHLQAKEYQRLPGNHQKLRERQGTDSSSQPSEGTNLAETLILDF